MVAISRRLSLATPPGTIKKGRILKGWQQTTTTTGYGQGTGWHPVGMHRVL
jgi:hypothetical protein